MRLLVVAFLWGAVSGYLAMEVGPIAAILVLAALFLGLKAFRGRLVHLGAFMLGAGISGVTVLGWVLLEAWKCDYQPCMSELTFPAFLASAATGLAGLALLLLFLIRQVAKR